MFTGMIQNWGQVQSVKMGANQTHLCFSFKTKEKQVQKGESIAVNGACLTATRISAASFEADLVQETLIATNLGNLKSGDWVNLERSMRVGDAIGGHFVTGHVDATGQIKKIEKRGGNWRLFVHAPKSIISQLVEKGSIACDGVSLTIQKIESRGFYVAVIPHTLDATTLGHKKIGASINLEVDHLTRYSNQTKSQKKDSSVLIRQLITQGF